MASKTNDAPSTRGILPSIVAMSRQRRSLPVQSSCTPTSEQRMGTVRSILAEFADAPRRLRLLFDRTPGDAGRAGRSRRALHLKLSRTSAPTDQFPSGTTIWQEPEGHLRTFALSICTGRRSPRGLTVRRRSSLLLGAFYRLARHTMTPDHGVTGFEADPDPALTRGGAGACALGHSKKRRQPSRQHWKIHVLVVRQRLQLVQGSVQVTHLYNTEGARTRLE